MFVGRLCNPLRIRSSILVLHCVQTCMKSKNLSSLNLLQDTKEPIEMK